MPRVPSISPATGRPTISSYIHTTDCNFVDNAGRTLLLRGVNLSGASKAPCGRPSHILEDFWESAESGGESFVGRPLNLDDGSADVHLARLAGWGFNMLRFPVTWEAIEHEGPGNYDYEYIDYTIRVLRKCKEYGFKVYMDPHQDTWSRFSGGSGAPFWTLAACGINPRNITATQAAIIHSEYPLAHDTDPASLPAMIWSTNYGRLLSQTVFTLFFAGRDFAPLCILDGKNIQDYLQEHYIEAMGRVADCIRDAGDLMDACVIGWDSLNEPFEGLCGWRNLNANPTAQGSTLKKGTHPTPAQSLRLGMGRAQTVENWAWGAMGPARDGSVTVDPKGLRLWADPAMEAAAAARWGWTRDPGWAPGTCPWALHGVWDVETGFVLQPEYFRYLPGSTADEVEFIVDYWKPHWTAFAHRIRAAHPEAIMFVQPPVFARPPPVSAGELRGRCAYSAHYYDGLTLVSRHWNWFNADALGLLRGKYSSTLQAVKIGTPAIRRSLREQLGYLKADAAILGAYPTLIGEIGTPMDMDGKRAYGWTDGGRYKGDYTRQERALDASLNAGDGANALGWTIWTYVPDATHQWGDGWNLEDLSLWCGDDLREEDDEGQGQGEEGCGTATENQAGLLCEVKGKGKDRQAMVSVHTASSVSLPTAVPPRGKSPPRTTALSRSKAVGPAGYHANPYDFLTDGARAVRAFCRPWPRKVVGRPKDIRFDFEKGAFRLAVTVRPEDRVVAGGGEGGEEEELATEIYVPLVHYASEGVLLARGKGTADVRSLSSALVSGIPRPCDTMRNASTLELGDIAVPSPQPSFASISTTRTANTASSGTATLHAPPSPGGGGGAVPGIDFSPLVVGAELVDVEVRVSAGRWCVEGQTLRWWYDVPAEGEREREYVIEIKRRGGAIKVDKTGCAVTGGGPRGVVEHGHGGESLCEKVSRRVMGCAEGCVIM